MSTLTIVVAVLAADTAAIAALLWLGHRRRAAERSVDNRIDRAIDEDLATHALAEPEQTRVV